MNNTRLLVMIPVFSALTAVGAFIELPIGPAPISLQSFFVILAGLVLGPRGGALSQIIYILLGLSGLPVFTAGGGLGYILRPSFGYLLGFVLAACVAGWLGQVLDARRPGRITVIAVVASLAIYAVGAPWLALNLKLVAHKPEAFSFALKSGLLLFLPGDLLKCLVIGQVYPRLKPGRP